MRIGILGSGLMGGTLGKIFGRVLLAVHWSRMDDVLTQAGDLSGKVIVTCSLPMDAGNTKLIIGTNASGSEELAKKVPRARVVCPLNTVPSEVLFDVYEARREATRPSLVYWGDDERAKGVTAGLIRDVGFDPVDAGPLRIARYTEPFALLVGQLAYQGEGGPSWRTGSSGSVNGPMFLRGMTKPVAF
jgi:predicted dinucleotide-binding enzyme